MNNYFLYNKIIKCADTNEVCVGYKEYLKSKQWRNKRSLIISINEKCSICGSIEKLEVHHLTYKNIGNEIIETDLLLLCEKCHKQVHKNKSSKEVSLYKKIKPKSKKKKKQKPKVCKYCRYFVIIKTKYGSKHINENYCNYNSDFNPTVVCKHFK